MDSRNKEVEMDIFSQLIPSPGSLGTTTINTVAVIPISFGSEKFKVFSLTKKNISHEEEKFKPEKTNFESVSLNS